MPPNATKRPIRIAGNDEPGVPGGFLISTGMLSEVGLLEDRLQESTPSGRKQREDTDGDPGAYVHLVVLEYSTMGNPKSPGEHK